MYHYPYSLKLAILGFVTALLGAPHAVASNLNTLNPIASYGFSGAALLEATKTARNKISHKTEIQEDKPETRTNNKQVRTDTPSGLAVPRFVSLKSNTTNCRIGPSLQHPRRLTYSRKGLPVKIIAETTDHWRKIEDSDGDHCWVHATLLSGEHTAMINTSETILYASPDQSSKIVAKLASRVVGKITKCRLNWCQIKIQKSKGWVLKQSIWGYKG